MEITARAFAGIGNPLKALDCVESKLNIASRIAPHIGIIAAIIINNTAFKTFVFILIGAFDNMASLEDSILLIRVRLQNLQHQQDYPVLYPRGNMLSVNGRKNHRGSRRSLLQVSARKLLLYSPGLQK